MDMTKSFRIYTDGSADPRTGYGGWAFVAIANSGAKSFSVCGQEYDTTNNRMELRAVHSAFLVVAKDYPITFITDSKYVFNGATQWIDIWEADNWKRKDGPIKNVDVWRWIAMENRRRILKWEWVARNEDPIQAQADKLAKAALEQSKEFFK